MSSKTAVVWSCSHSDPDVSNERFDWLGNLIYDIRPDLVVDLGDGADMRSLNSFDTRYPQKIVNQSYERDINHYNDSQERLRHKFKYLKKKRPFWVGHEGNHEFRIKRAVEIDPRLEGDRYGVSFKHLQTDHWFDEYYEYQDGGPSLSNYEGIYFSHFISAGNMGTAMSGVNHASSMVNKFSSSITVGHSHKFDYKYKGNSVPRPTHGLVVGCFKGKRESWAGQANNEWRHGVAIKRNIRDGDYNLTWVSMEALEEEYGR